jgi:hypothetical protein
MMMTRKLLGCAAAFFLSIGLAANARAAEAQDPKEPLRILYMLIISQDICDFDATDTQSELLEKATDALQEAAKMSDDDADKFYTEIEDGMKKQKDTAGLCDAKGEWAKAYEAGIAALGK